MPEIPETSRIGQSRNHWCNTKQPDYRLTVELASQDIVDKLFLGLVVHPSSLVLEDEIVIPSTLDGKASGGRCPSVGSRRRGHLTQSGLKVQKRVSGSDLGLPVYAVGLRSLLLLRRETQQGGC